MSKFKRVLEGIKNVFIGEFNEIREIVPTEADKKQGEIMAELIRAALASFGIPSTSQMEDITSRVCAYAIRDLKDGAKEPSKLIIGRVITEIKERRKK